MGRDAGAAPRPPAHRPPGSARKGRSRRARREVIVLDASALLELLLGTDAGRLVAERLDAPEETFHAPHLVEAEVMHALRRYVNAADIDAEKAKQALSDLAALRLTKYCGEAEAEVADRLVRANGPRLTRDVRDLRGHIGARRVTAEPIAIARA